MDEATATDGWTPYLVEGYRPGVSVDALTQAARRLRAAAAEMAREGEQVRFVRSAIVPGDESCLVLIEAGSESLVREVYARAGVHFERISAAITVETQRPSAGG